MQHLTGTLRHREDISLLHYLIAFSDSPEAYSICKLQVCTAASLNLNLNLNRNLETDGQYLCAAALALHTSRRSGVGPIYCITLSHDEMNTSNSEPAAPLPRPGRSTEPVSPVSGDSESAEESLFTCNICYEIAANPVVTLCGHLYCWTCIYR